MEILLFLVFLTLLECFRRLELGSPCRNIIPTCKNSSVYYISLPSRVSVFARYQHSSLILPPFLSQGLVR